MNTITLVVLALGLAMDAFAVSLSNALCYQSITPRQMTGSALAFGVFQGVMPVVGFFAGSLLGNIIMQVDHWLALVLLGIIGGKMLVEGARQLKKGDCECENKPYTVQLALVQAVATSIDALAVGIGFAALAVNIWYAAALIAAITFACCFVGGQLGARFGEMLRKMQLGSFAQILGGLILLAIGIKIFAEHMAEHGM